MLVGPKAEALGERVVHDSHVQGSATYISERETHYGFGPRLGVGMLNFRWVKCLFVQSCWAVTDMAQTCDIFQGLHLSRLLRLLPSVCHLIKGVAGSSLFALFTIMGCWLFTATVAGPCHCQHAGCQFDGFLWPRFWEVIKWWSITHAWVKQLVP